jgi:hypothetical protein
MHVAVQRTPWWKTRPILSWVRANAASRRHRCLPCQGRRSFLLAFLLCPAGTKTQRVSPEIPWPCFRAAWSRMRCTRDLMHPGVQVTKKRWGRSICVWGKALLCYLCGQCSGIASAAAARAADDMHSRTTGGFLNISITSLPPLSPGAMAIL